MLNTQKTNCQNENIINENEERINNLCLYCGQNKIKNKKGKTHELLTVDFARFNRANNGDKMNTQINKDNFEQRKNCNTQNSYNSNKVSLSSKGRINTTYQKRYNIVQSTVILLSWLFVFLLSAMIVYFTNVNNNNLINLQNNVVAEGVNTFADESTRKGTGTSGDPYQISTMADLEFLSNEDNSSYWSASFLQTKDIPYTSSTWSPIGNETTKFTGDYNGNGFNIIFSETISYNYQGGGYYLGLFGYTYQANITNLKVVYNLDENINDENYVGMVYTLKGSGVAYVGGIVGYADQTIIKNCQKQGSICGMGTAYYAGDGAEQYLGGILGEGNQVQIESCESFGTLKLTADYDSEPRVYVGGIVGNLYTTKTYSYVNSTVKKCYNESQIYGYSNTYYSDYGPFTYAGGISGCAGTIEECFNVGNIMALTGTACGNTQVFLGGIAGAAGAVNNCFNTGTLSVEQTQSDGVYVGGIVGLLTKDYNISKCYNIGTINLGEQVSNTAYDFGGIVGYVQSSITNYNIEGCYYLTDCVESQANSFGTKKDSNALKQLNTFTNWKFDTVWAIDKTGVINNGYPYLQVFYPPQTAVVSFNVNTNVSAILNITDENGENSQQIFITPETAQSIELELSLKDYVVVISTYYTTNISFADSNGQATTTVPNGQTLTKNVLTFTASQGLVIRLNLNGFVGNNGIVI